MAGKSFTLTKPVQAQEAFEYLKANLHSPKVTGITYDSNMDRVDIAANYYTYQISFVGNQMTIMPKMEQKWMIIILACVLVGLVLFVPWAIAIVLVVLVNLEAKEILTLIYQIMNMMPVPQQA